MRRGESAFLSRATVRAAFEVRSALASCKASQGAADYSEKVAAVRHAASDLAESLIDDIGEDALEAWGVI